MKRKQNKKQKEFPVRVIAVTGFVLITAVIWTLPFDMYRLIARTFSPEASSESDWIFSLFIRGTPFLGALLLIFADALKKKNLVMSLVVWLSIAYVIHWLAIQLTFAAFYKN